MSRKSAKAARPPRERPSNLVLALAGLALIILVVFSASLHSQLVYDSSEEIVAWDFIHQPGNILIPLTFRLMTLDVLDFNRPVAVASLMYDSMIWGHNSLGYHLTNILLHVLAAGLTFFLIRHILAFRDDSPGRSWRTGIAFLATLLFSLHPLVTEAVCEPSNRKDLLAAVFGLGALLLAGRHRLGWGPGDPIRMVLIPLLCLLAVGSKEVGAAYPAILTVYWFIFRRGEPHRFWTWTLLASFAVTIAFLVARFVLAHNPSVIFQHPPTYPARNLFETAFEVQPRILARYIFNIVWPLYLSADYTPYSIRFLPDWLAYPVLGLLAGLAMWWGTKDRRAGFGALFVVLCVLPVCNIVPIYHPAADRYLYNPLVGLALLVAVALDHPWLRAKISRQTVATLFILLLVAFLLPITMQRQAVWSTELNLWKDTAEKDPDSFVARIGLPEVLLHLGRVEEARESTEDSLHAGFTNSTYFWVDYAIEMERLGQHARAQQAAKIALALQPDIGDAEKMSRNLQIHSDFAHEFARIVATVPSTGLGP